jgi:hypothetical protein
MGNGDDYHAARNDPVDDSKWKPPHGAFAMHGVHSAKSLRIGRDGGHRSINRIHKAYRRALAPLGIPIKRFLKVEAGPGKVVNG